MHSQFRIAAATCSLPCAYAQLHFTNLTSPTHARLASTSSKPPPFPFPSHRNPTPHQIFHLGPGASQADIKARYYELARTFHPDSPTAKTLPASVRQARFHAVTRAYDVLRGKSSHSLGGPADDVEAELARRRRQRQLYRRRAVADFAEAAGVGGADEA